MSEGYKYIVGEGSFSALTTEDSLTTFF